MKSLSVVNRLPTLEKEIGVRPGIACGTALLACVALVCSSSVAMAQAGQLDQSFGAGGVFATDSTQQFQFAAGAVALQSDGKIVVAGAVSGLPGLLRLTASGTLDPTFGNGGIARIILPIVLGGGGALVVGVAVQLDGKIVFAIRNDDIDADRECHIVSRVNADGNLDTAFGDGGFGVSSTENRATDVSNVLALQPDGKIVVAGTSMARFDTSGRLDSTFGTGGVAALKNFAGAMVLQPDGKILVASSGPDVRSVFSIVRAGPRGVGANVVSRYNPDGSLDSDFGIFGQAAVVGPMPGVVLQSDGTIVMAGTLVDAVRVTPRVTTTGFGVLRYNSDGSIDTSFGAHGGVINDFGSAQPFALANALVQQADGRLVVAGAAGDQNSSNFAMARYTTSGLLDTGFGSGGEVLTGFGNNLATCVALAVQSDGKIVAVGDSGFFDFPRFINNIVVVRYLGQ